MTSLEVLLISCLFTTSPGGRLSRRLEESKLRLTEPSLAWTVAELGSILQVRIGGEYCSRKWQFPTDSLYMLATYGTHAPGITSHVKYPGVFLNECSVWSFWGTYF